MVPKNSPIPFVTIYGHGGPLEGELQQISDAFRFDPAPSRGNLARRVLARAAREADLRKFYLQHYWRRRGKGRSAPGLIYSNAVTNYRVLSAIVRPGVPVITHCHEMESVIHRTGLEGFRRTCEMTTHFIAASAAVKDNLVEKHAVAPEKIDLIHEFIPIDSSAPGYASYSREQIFAELGIPPEAMVVGASGTLYWRKGPELFVQIADLLRKRSPDLPIWFVWVGGGEKGDFRFFELDHDIEKLGLSGRVRFLEHKADPRPYFAALDLFLMISREDTYPLVCLETAAMGKPIICFANAGGTPEFVEQDCGFVVPYLDLEAVAERIIKLYRKPALRAEMGRAAAEKVRQRHDIEVAAPLVLRLIDEHRLK